MQRTRRPPRLLMTVTAYAQRIGVSQSAISHAVQRGIIIPTDRGMIDAAQADAVYGRRRRERAPDRVGHARDAGHPPSSIT
jgi:hypothetical protein